MIRGAKEKKERALGENLGLKAHRSFSPKSALVRRPNRPGVHGASRRRALSDFGKQIREKQKFKLSYGIDETTLRNLFQKASKHHSNISGKLLELLERRLDNALYRGGIAPSRYVARQMVLHGHVRVNGRRVRSPGYQLSKGDVVSPYSNIDTLHAFKEAKESLKKHNAPDWLTVDAQKLEIKVAALPDSLESPFEINLLVESFSK